MSRRWAATLAVTGAFLILCSMPKTSLGADQGGTKQSEDLLSLGTLGPSPIALSVWTNQPPGYKFKAGDRVVIYFKVDRDCYVTALNISTQGDVTVLFPSKEHPDNHVKAGEQYSLFGDDSRIRLVMGTGLPEVKTVFYATSEPVSLDPLM
ncbi:MAG: DUF4384 domain-containing protein, partial [Desulfomonile tiedjei]|nr:DUF4384 domain-containing protein [Desulfomonile tiedjei]